MDPTDAAAFQQAMFLANSGQKEAAYQQFCAIRDRSIGEDTTLLYWIAYTTPSPYECQDIINRLSQLTHGDSTFYKLQNYYDRQWRNIGPLLFCPYCQVKGPTAIKSRVTAGGWIIFIILLLLPPLTLVCWIGLLIRSNYNVCSRCGGKLGA